MVWREYSKAVAGQKGLGLLNLDFGWLEDVVGELLSVKFCQNADHWLPFTCTGNKARKTWGNWRQGTSIHSYYAKAIISDCKYGSVLKRCLEKILHQWLSRAEPVRTHPPTQHKSGPGNYLLSFSDPCFHHAVKITDILKSLRAHNLNPVGEHIENLDADSKVNSDGAVC